MTDPPMRDVADLLALHPWPSEFRDASPLHYLWRFEFPVAPATLWPIIADTSRLNRALGLSPMNFREVDGRRRGDSKSGGVAHEWEEVPWNWVAEQWLTCLRLYSRGFPKAVYAIHRLEPIAAGTRLYLYFGAIPSGIVGSGAIRLGFPVIERAYRRILPGLARQLSLPVPSILRVPPPPLSPEAEAKVVAARAALIEKGLAPQAVDTLLAWVRTADDDDVVRIQLRERARVWAIPLPDLLRVALHATRAGLLDLSWDIVCPHCRGVREEEPHIAGIPAAASCEVCNVTFGTGDPESIEVTFRIHPAVRAVGSQLFCSAEPSKKDHIRVQLAVPPGGEHTVRPLLSVGGYRARVDSDARMLTVADGGAASWTWSAGPQPSEGANPVTPELTLAPNAEITLSNPHNRPLTFVIERSGWRDDALRPSDLLSCQEFRDLFADEYISAGVQLSVGQQTILFTDVVGSTAFYVERGDPAAFSEVKRHFDELFAIIAAHRGAVIKTIGDACMGAFGDPLDAVRASEAIHAAYSPQRADSPLRLRISLNTGPCIAVRLNSALDYFGGTVNFAAKLQAHAETWQVAMADTTYRSPGVAEYVSARGARLVEQHYTTAALAAPLRVWQWTVFGSSQ